MSSPLPSSRKRPRSARITAADRKRAAVEAAAAQLDHEDPYAGIDVADISALPVPADMPVKKFRARKAARKAELEPEEEPEEPSEDILPANAQYISASSTRNYLLRDPCLDWFQCHGNGEPRVASLEQKTAENFTDFIMEKGCQFEVEVVKLIVAKFGTDFLHLGGTGANARDPAMFEKTLIAMKAGVPILYSAVLHHAPSRTFGIPDLIVRSDYLARLVELHPLAESQTYSPSAPATLLVGENGEAPPYHYLIVDIKYTTLHLRANGTHLLNQGSIPAYKGQMYIYNRALAAAQGYDPRHAFLLGRRWSYTSRDETYSGDSCFERLGTIDFAWIDREIPALTNAAVAWRRKVLDEGAQWDIYKPHVTELYPNMSNHADWPWGKAKKEVATALADVTMLWMCGPKNRRCAHADGITRWDDPNCTPMALGIKGEYTAPILEAILDAQRGKNILNPEYIALPSARTRLWIDFETRNDVFDDFSTMPYAGGSTLIFMIGIGYEDEETKEFVYRDFTVRNFSRAEEHRIALEATEYIDSFGKDVSLRHWSHHEPSCWYQVVERYEDVYEAWSNVDAEWTDLLKIIRGQQVGIKGALGYGLKEVVRALHKHGLIKTSYESSEVADGADAMVLAYKAEKEAGEQGISVRQTPTMRAIIHYNRLDCQVLMELEQAIEKHNAAGAEA
jgi:hypothetical protein